MIRHARFTKILGVLLLLSGCATLQQIVALRQVAFSLDGTGEASLAGVDLDRVRSFEDLSVLDAGRLALAVARDELPLEFTLRVQAENPSENSVTATLSRFSWALFLDDRETVSGMVDGPYGLAPGEPEIVPVRVRLDLIDFFDGSAESLVNLAAGIAGLGGDPSRVALSVVPTIETPIGPIDYPRPITVTYSTGR